MTKPKEPKTHFEHVSLEIVKEIAGADTEKGEKGEHPVRVKLPSKQRGALRALKAHRQNAQ